MLTVKSPLMDTFTLHHESRSGNFIGASGSDKQMLCASSGARAAQNIGAEKVNKRGRSVTRRKILFLWGSFSQKGELHAALKSFNSFLP